MKTFAKIASSFFLFLALWALALVAMPAESIPPRHIFSAPVYIQNGTTVLQSFYEDGGGSLAASAFVTGSSSISGKLTVDGGAVIHNSLAATGGMITDTLTVTSAAGNGTVLAGGALAYASDPVPAISQYSGALPVTVGLTEKWGSSTLLDGGKLVAFTSAFAYQDGGPPLCTCSTLGVAPTAVSCDAVAAGTGVTASGVANSTASFVYHCIGPQ